MMAIPFEDIIAKTTSKVSCTSVPKLQTCDMLYQRFWKALKFLLIVIREFYGLGEEGRSRPELYADA